MADITIKTILYLGDVQIGDINAYVKNRHLSESLKSEQDSATSDQFTFDINWKKFKEFVAVKFDDDPASFLRVGKTRVVFIINGRVRFAGWLATRPARSGYGPEQTLSLTFFEYFARLSGDLVCSSTNTTSPMRVFTNRPAHLYTQDLIDEFKARAAAAGETLNWSYGVINTLANKTITYKDFQTVSKALCDAMNNVDGAGKYDVVFRTDPEDYTHQIIDILQPRGSDKNIIIKYPSDGVYALWSNGYQIDETSEYASEVLVSGRGQVGDPETGEDTAELGVAVNSDFVQEYCYWRNYTSDSSVGSLAGVQARAKTLLAQKDFGKQTPQISIKGIPIEWGNTSNMDNGLAVGDSFYFEENNDDGSNQSGQMRIIGMETDYDNNGVATVEPSLKRLDA